MTPEPATGERMYPKTFSEVSPDHKHRYLLALGYIPEKGRVLDAACGVGYGTHFMAVNADCAEVVGLDISEHALGWAHRYFRSSANRFARADLDQPLPESLTAHRYDLITSFETVEHLHRDAAFLKQLAGMLKEKGCLIVSAPNEGLIPHRANPLSETGINPFHHRHYSFEALVSLAAGAGLYLERAYTQFFDTVLPGRDGFLNILVCRNIPVKPIPHTDLDQIIRACSLLRVTENNIRKNLEFTALASRFSEILVAYEKLADAWEKIQAGGFETAIGLLEGIDKAVCPEKYFFEALVHKETGNDFKAVENFARIAARPHRFNATLVRHSKDQLDLINARLRKTLTETDEQSAVMYGDGGAGGGVR